MEGETSIQERQYDIIKTDENKWKGTCERCGKVLIKPIEYKCRRALMGHANEHLHKTKPVIIGSESIPETPQDTIISPEEQDLYRLK